MGLDQELHKIRVSRDVPGHGKVNVQVTQSHSLMLFDVHCLEHCLISPEGRQ